MPSPAIGLRLRAWVWTIATLWLCGVGSLSSAVPMPDQCMAEKSHISRERRCYPAKYRRERSIAIIQNNKSNESIYLMNLICEIS
jgi:hypothetical protein